jgi:hypothetical protein
MVEQQARAGMLHLGRTWGFAKIDLISPT